MPADDQWDQLFPRSLAGRIGLGLASLCLAPLSELMLYGLLLRAPRPRAVADWLLLIVVEEFLLGLFLFFTAGVIWAAWTPRWLERLRALLARKLALGMLMFMIPAGVLAFWTILAR